MQKVSVEAGSASLRDVFAGLARFLAVQAHLARCLNRCIRTFSEALIKAFEVIDCLVISSSVARETFSSRFAVVAGRCTGLADSF